MLGRAEATDTEEPFSAAYLAIRGSSAINGVSRLHGEMSRRIFQPLSPRWPEAEVLVGAVTNGIHVPSWDSADADNVWTAACGAEPERWRGAMETVGDALRRVSDTTLWQMRSAAQGNLIHYARDHLDR